MMHLTPQDHVDERSEASAETPSQLHEITQPATKIEPLSHYSYEGEREHRGSGSPFFANPKTRVFQSPAPLSGDDRAAPDDESRGLRARIDAMALRELDVEIAVRESELATMRRARAAIAGGTERNETKKHVAHGAHIAHDDSTEPA